MRALIAQATKNTITLKGSTEIVTEFFGYSINSILYQVRRAHTAHALCSRHSELVLASSGLRCMREHTDAAVLYGQWCIYAASSATGIFAPAPGA